MNRRNFLTYSTSIASIPYMSEIAHALPRTKQTPKREKSVVFLFLGGGPTHIELTHANPNLTPEQRSVVGEIQTKITGYHLGGLFNEVAKYSDRMNFVKSYGHTNANHQNAVYWQFSGRIQNQTAQTEPSIGSMITKNIGPNSPQNGIPTHLSITKTDGESAAWLGSLYNPFEANDRGVKDLTLSVTEEQLNRRINILNLVENKTKWITDQAWNDAKKIRYQALDLIRGDVKSAFEVKHEPDHMRDWYGRNFIGDSMLLARRLIQNGGRYININYGGWDMHGDIKRNLESRVPPMDKAIAAFIQDICALGLEKQVLLVVTGDFGRTPKLNNGNNGSLPGRDHWAQLCTLFTFGGEYEQGRVIGKSDRLESVKEENPFEPKDLAYTVLNHFGINGNTLVFTDNGGRPRYATEGGRLIL